MTVDDILARHGLRDIAGPLREHLLHQRWFAGREREVRTITVDDALVLRDDEPAVVALIVRVVYAEGPDERYHVPLAIRAGGTEGGGDVAIVSTVDRGGPALVYDALSDGPSAWAYWELAAAGATIKGMAGDLIARGEALDLGPAGGETVRPMVREQSNSSLVRDGFEIMKCLRRLSGNTPEVEMLEALATAGFGGIAPPLAIVEYWPHDQEREVLALIQPYLHNGTDGWALALASLRDLYALTDEHAPTDLGDAPSARDAGSSFEPEAQRLGEVLGRMHIALAGPGLPAPMRAHRAGPEDVRAWHAEMRQDLAELLDRHGAALAPLRDRRAAVEGCIDALLTVADPGMAVRQHGDLHLGQVLRTDQGWTVLDFEGEPSRPAAARRVRSSPLRDVAGMLRSLDYAAMVELSDWGSPGESAWQRLRAQGESWVALNREAFCSTYRATVADHRLLPRPADVDVMLRAFEVQKAIYEVAYEIAHRPKWVEIPLDFILRSTA